MLAHPAAPGIVHYIDTRNPKDSSMTTRKQALAEARRLTAVTGLKHCAGWSVAKQAWFAVQLIGVYAY